MLSFNKQLLSIIYCVLRTAQFLSEMNIEGNLICRPSGLPCSNFLIFLCLWKALYPKQWVKKNFNPVECGATITKTAKIKKEIWIFLEIPLLPQQVPHSEISTTTSTKLEQELAYSKETRYVNWVLFHSIPLFHISTVFAFSKTGITCSADKNLEMTPYTLFVRLHFSEFCLSRQLNSHATLL